MTVRILLFISLVSQPFFEDFYQRATVAFQQGHFEEVISLLAKLPKNEMDRPAPYNLKALALAELRRYDEALVVNQRAQELDPANVNYLYNAGLIHLAKGDFQESEQCFRRGIDRFPRSLQLYRGLGEALFKLNRFPEAEQWLRKTVEIDPTSAPTHVVLARLFYALGDRESFGAAASKAIQLDPQSHLACYLYGTWLIEDLGQLQEGSDYVQKSITLSPQFVEGIKYWARMLMREGRVEEAARMYEKATAIDSQDRQLYYFLAVVYRKLNQQEKVEWALKEYKRISK